MGALLSLPREERLLYPTEALQGLTTALVGFCAAFLGRQDSIWIKEAGLVATCVDTDAERLIEMSGLYPTGWKFVCADFYDHAVEQVVHGYKYDVVSLDPPTDQFLRCGEWLPLWAALARRVVILGTGHNTPLNEPEGWKIAEVRKRSTFRGGTYWTTLEPV